MQNFVQRKIFILLALLVLSSSCVNYSSPTYNTPLLVGNKKISAQVVSTPEEMEQGLSGREKLNDNQGMLFDFKKPGQPGFWMKDMKFDLDLIWIFENKIVGITSNVPAPKSTTENLPVYSPETQVDMVLEVNAGWAKENKIKINDEVKF